MTRKRAVPPVAIPEWLAVLEQREPDAILPKAGERLRAAGLREIGAEGHTDHPTAIVARGAAISLRSDVRWDEVNSPVVTAVNELIEYAPVFASLHRLHVASTDMSLVASAARELAKYRHSPGTDEEVPHNPHFELDQVAEVGLVVTYARSFTGNAALGDKWRPPKGPDRQLHDQLMDDRNAVQAHAGWTSARTIVDTNAMLGVPGPPIIAEARKQRSKTQLLELADLAGRQADRFLEEVGRLKMELGVGNAPWPEPSDSEGDAAAERVSPDA